MFGNSNTNPENILVLQITPSQLTTVYFVDKPPSFLFVYCLKILSLNTRVLCCIPLALIICLDILAYLLLLCLTSLFYSRMVCWNPCQDYFINTDGSITIKSYQILKMSFSILIISAYAKTVIDVSKLLHQCWWLHQISSNNNRIHAHKFELKISLNLLIIIAYVKRVMATQLWIHHTGKRNGNTYNQVNRDGRIMYHCDAQSLQHDESQNMTISVTLILTWFRFKFPTFAELSPDIFCKSLPCKMWVVITEAIQQRIYYTNGG